MIFLSLVCAMRFYVFAFTAALGLPHVFLIAMVPVYGMIYILSNQILQYKNKFESSSDGYGIILTYRII
jgi:predicted neutral ceramidase superfamily lipid hydrolase